MMKNTNTVAGLTGVGRLPLTANYHFIKSCNFRCLYCYATFSDVIGRPTLPDDQVLELTGLLAQRYSKVTFVGGEPTLYRRLPELLVTARDKGALTNVVTNGSRINVEWLHEMSGVLDFLTLSIDSTDPATHLKVGRATQSGMALTSSDYLALADASREHGIAVKVNTVITTVNAAEDMSALVKAIGPERWKILQAAPVEGQNDSFITDLTPSREVFDSYVSRARRALAESRVLIVDEPIDVIRGSYIMVDPHGRFFDSATGVHHYSSPILDVGLDEAFAEVAFDRDKFVARGGEADWTRATRG